jgi:hypothetical protein
VSHRALTAMKNITRTTAPITAPMPPTSVVPGLSSSPVGLVVFRWRRPRRIFPAGARAAELFIDADGGMAAVADQRAEENAWKLRDGKRVWLARARAEDHVVVGRIHRNASRSGGPLRGIARDRIPA